MEKRLGIELRYLKKSLLHYSIDWRSLDKQNISK